jgi:hypothetical protein
MAKRPFQVSAKATKPKREAESVMGLFRSVSTTLTDCEADRASGSPSSHPPSRRKRRSVGRAGLSGQNPLCRSLLRLNVRLGSAHRPWTTSCRRPNRASRYRCL